MKSLSYLTDQELNQKLKILVNKEREILHEILEHIKEVDIRKTYLSLAYPSTFEYLTKELGYSPASAMRRLNAARLLKDVPKMAQEIQTGNLNLSQISEIARGIKDKERVTFKKVTTEQKQDLVFSVLNKTTHETQALVAKALDIKIVEHEKQKIQKDDSVRLEITLTQDQYNKLKKCKDLLAANLHQKGHSTNWADVIEALEDQYLNKRLKFHEESKRNETQVSRPLNASDVSAAEMSDGNGQVAQSFNSIKSIQKPKNVTGSIKKYILHRDKKCQYVDKKTGRKCESTYGLEIDHKQSKWVDGSNEIKNLQALCKAHNLFKYRKEVSIAWKS